jgi:pimeloyl-ACP methyl ester carboxylesterase
MELAHQLWGRSGAPRLLFLHGMGGTGALWRPIAATLEDEFQILAPDQRGHGQSRPAPGGYTPRDYGQDVVDTVERLGFYPAVVVGHSMGVRTACAVAHLRPAWTRGLVLIDLGFTGPAGGGLGDGLASFLRILPMSFPSRPAAQEFMTRECPDPSIAQYLMAVSTRAPDGGLSFPFDRDALLATLEAAREAAIGPWVREAAGRGIPVWVLRGAQSRVWLADEFQREQAAFAGTPGMRFETFEGAGHGLPFEQRARFVDALRGWVRGLPAPG